MPFSYHFRCFWAWEVFQMPRLKAYNHDLGPPKTWEVPGTLGGVNLKRNTAEQ
jgi:hypothetical protein